MEKLVYRLPVFEGPLDALLYLISKNKLNIYDIPITELLSQYLEYLGSMQEMDLEITSDFLEMASRLVQIKSSMLLPRYDEDDDAGDPRDELVTALIGYKTCKAMAQTLRRQGTGFDCFVRSPSPVEHDETYALYHERAEIFYAYLAAKGRAKRRLPPPVSAFRGVVGKRIVSVVSRVVHIVKRLMREGSRPLPSLFEDARYRSEAVATFLAVLELVKSNRIYIDEAEGEQRVRIRRRRGGKLHGKWEEANGD